MVKISEAFDDPVPLPSAVDICWLIEKAEKREPFTDYDYQWLRILLEELWYSQEFRLRMRLYKVEGELSEMHKERSHERAVAAGLRAVEGADEESGG